MAKAVAEAINPDNLQAPDGLTLAVKRRGAEISIEVRCPKGVGNLLSTLDDLLSCLSAAEKTIDGLDP